MGLRTSYHLSDSRGATSDLWVSHIFGAFDECTKCIEPLQWNELDRILQLDAGGTECPSTCCRPPADSPILKHPVPPLGSASSGAAKSPALSSWADAWHLYEDVCLVCASLWIGSWRGNSTQSYSTLNADGSRANWGAVRLEGDDDLTIDGPVVRSIGLGIEGRPSFGGGAPEGGLNMKGPKRSRGMSLGLGGSSGTSENIRDRQASTSSGLSAECIAVPALYTLDDPMTQRLWDERMERQIRTTLALLQTFHANSCFQLSKLAELLQPQPSVSRTTTGQLMDIPPIAETPNPTARTPPDSDIVYITPRDVLSFELGPFSALDAHYLEWLGEEYGGGKTVVVKRAWKDLMSIIFGFG